MRIAPNQAAVVMPPAAQTAVVTPAQAIGAVLRVEVLAQLDLLRYKLRTPNGERIAESRTPLNVGDKLALQVVGGDDKRLLVDKMPTPAQQANTQLKTFLPKQLDASRLMALLPALAANVEAPEGVTQLLEHLPKPSQLMQADTLQQAIKNSGLFYERSLAQGILPPPEDLKRQILQLRDELKQKLGADASSQTNSAGASHAAGKVEALQRVTLPNSLLEILALSLPSSMLQLLGQELDGVLARMISHQLLHAGDEQKQHQQWLMELPVQDRDGIDLLQIHISKDQRQASQQQPGFALWKVSLSLSLPAKGAVIATLSQQDERVHVQFHAEQADTHAWINQNCPALRQRLLDCGLQVGHVQAQRGLPHDDTLPKGASGLLQERA